MSLQLKLITNSDHVWTWKKLMNVSYIFLQRSSDPEDKLKSNLFTRGTEVPLLYSYTTQCCGYWQIPDGFSHSVPQLMSSGVPTHASCIPLSRSYVKVTLLTNRLTHIYIAQRKRWDSAGGIRVPKGLLYSISRRHFRICFSVWDSQCYF